MIPTLDYPQYERQTSLDVLVSGWIEKTYSFAPSRLLPIGGSLFHGTAKHRATFEFNRDQAKTKETVMAVRGAVSPQEPDQPIRVHLVDPDGQVYSVEVKTDVHGQFAAEFDVRRVPSRSARPDGRSRTPPQGTYMAQAAIINAPRLAQTTSNQVIFKL